MPQQAVRRIQLASLVALALSSDPLSALAEGGQINARADLEYQFSDIQSKDNSTGETTDTDFSRFKQKYDVDLQKEIFPFLQFRSGGIFEFIDVSTTVDDADFDSNEKTHWLYAELNLDNPLYTGGSAYRRQKFEFDPTGFPKTEIDREEISGLFRWEPVGFPIFDLNVDHVRTWDNYDTTNQYIDRIIFKSRYDYKDLFYDYTFTRIDTDEKVEDTGSLLQIHNAGLQYSRNFFGDQLQLNAGARLNYQTQKQRGEGEIERPTSPAGSPFFLTDDSDPNTLTPVGPGDPLTTINIGRNGPNNAVAVGLGFGFPTAMNRVHILPLVDPNDLALATPAEIAAVASGYVWRVFWSDDQMNWTELNVISATYTIIDNRFEITFARIDNARFLKVVTDPQTTAAGEIRTASIQAFTTFAVDPGTEIKDLDQSVNLGLRWLISEKTEASYDGYFRYEDNEPFNLNNKTLTNSISVTHSLLPWLVADARVLRTDADERDNTNLTHHSYSTSLRADYLTTLHQTLVYSGYHDDMDGGTTYANSVFLRTNADLYQGWSSNLDLGYSSRHLIEGDHINTSTFRISTDLDPNPKLNFVIDYRLSWNTQTGEPSWLDQYARFQGFWVPLRTLTLFAAVRLRYRERFDDGLQVAQDYAVNWSPFPDGLLRITLGYNRTVDTRNNTTNAFLPQIDWQLTRTTLLSVRFNMGTVETDQAKDDVKNVRLTLQTYY